jgi:hypothetical protein
MHSQFESGTPDSVPSKGTLSPLRRLSLLPWYCCSEQHGLWGTLHRQLAWVVEAAAFWLLTWVLLRCSEAALPIRLLGLLILKNMTLECQTESSHRRVCHAVCWIFRL